MRAAAAVVGGRGNEQECSLFGEAARGAAVVLGLDPPAIEHGLFQPGRGLPAYESRVHRPQTRIHRIARGGNHQIEPIGNRISLGVLDRVGHQFDQTVQLAAVLGSQQHRRGRRAVGSPELQVNCHGCRTVRRCRGLHQDLGRVDPQGQVVKDQLDRDGPALAGWHGETRRGADPVIGGREGHLHLPAAQVRNR